MTSLSAENLKVGDLIRNNYSQHPLYKWVPVTKIRKADVGMLEIETDFFRELRWFTEQVEIKPTVATNVNIFMGKLNVGKTAFGG